MFVCLGVMVIDKLLAFQRRQEEENIVFKGSMYENVLYLLTVQMSPSPKGFLKSIFSSVFAEQFPFGAF